MMVILIVGAVVCVIVGACIALICLMGLRKQTAQPAQAVPTEVMAHAIPMGDFASVQMAAIPVKAEQDIGSVQMVAMESYARQGTTKATEPGREQSCASTARWGLDGCLATRSRLCQSAAPTPEIRDAHTPAKCLHAQA